MAQTLQGRLVIPPPATPPRGPGSDRQPVNCAACLGTDIELRQIRCGCHYCRPCMHQMFLFSIRNRVWWPPKCHNSSASEDDVVWTGDDDLLKMFREVAYEMSIDNPLYCWQPRCSALLDLNAPRVHDGTNAVACPKCHALTCINCKREHHPDKPTCEDPGLDPGLQVYLRQRILLHLRLGLENLRMPCSEGRPYRAASVDEYANGISAVARPASSSTKPAIPKGTLAAPITDVDSRASSTRDCTEGGERAPSSYTTAATSSSASPRT
ncbi:hypothetical protein AAE478_008431 [Parahypoxylon ruwenzoriense]